MIKESEKLFNNWNLIKQNIDFKKRNNYFNKNSFLTFSQFRTIDKKRFIEKIWKINKEDFLDIKKELKNIIF